MSNRNLITCSNIFYGKLLLLPHVASHPSFFTWVDGSLICSSLSQQKIQKDYRGVVSISRRQFFDCQLQLFYAKRVCMVCNHACLMKSAIWFIILQQLWQPVQYQSLNTFKCNQWYFILNVNMQLTYYRYRYVSIFHLFSLSWIFKLIKMAKWTWPWRF